MQFLEDIFLPRLRMMKYTFKLVSVLCQFYISDLGGCTVAIVWPTCLV